uniref:RNA helicase n=1 Tax=Albugo laibachii Nc14 TaxID=890382 RepID=F0WG75_9STRA|nr:ATPdependent RNA helicase SUPV3L1 putative [Albugo laibachii Nc14]|eukprot:CCA20210.1 ATPdependent RNA helicase SUPV3L1 putative [Albugo laibachii Nc14]
MLHRCSHFRRRTQLLIAPQHKTCAEIKWRTQCKSYCRFSQGSRMIVRIPQLQINHPFSFDRCIKYSTARHSSSLASEQPNYEENDSLQEKENVDAQNTRIFWPSGVAKDMNRILKAFPRDLDVKKLAVGSGMNANEWPLISSAFQKQFLKNPSKFFRTSDELLEFVDAFRQKLDTDRSIDVSVSGSSTMFLFYPMFLSFATKSYYFHDQTKISNDPMQTTKDGAPSINDDVEITALKLRELTDLRLPHELYPRSNGLKRKIIYHEGPTNSGKTHNALERLKNASIGGEYSGGLYCGPLRLLALEIYERMNLEGFYTSLITGQEKKIMPHATHVASTVEMANINVKWDVAVIDEVQLIGDLQRGWAWTRALFGLQAREIHVCGSGDAVNLIRNFAETTGDDFELKSYKRRSSLEIETSHVSSLSQIQAGDCVVAFSRREIYQIKRDIERTTGMKCCIVYGLLPPQTRSQQARLFNDPNSGYSVLVASDAIGMGLNLNIRRIIFSNVKKYNGASGGMADISPSLVKQIAGRAGRYGTQFADVGKVSSFRKEDLDYIRTSFYEPLTPLRSAGLFPNSEQMEQFAAHLPGVTDLAELVDKYVMLARLDGEYFMCNHADLKESADLLKDIPLVLSDRFTFCMAPLNTRNMLARRIFQDYASAHAKLDRVKLDIYLPRYAPRTSEALRDVEIKAQIIDLYLWLSQRFPDTFVEQELAITLKTQVLSLVEQGLHNTTYNVKNEQNRSPRSIKFIEKGAYEQAYAQRKTYIRQTQRSPQVKKEEPKASSEDLEGLSRARKWLNSLSDSIFQKKA